MARKRWIHFSRGFGRLALLALPLGIAAGVSGDAVACPSGFQRDDATGQCCGDYSGSSAPTAPAPTYQCVSPTQAQAEYARLHPADSPDEPGTTSTPRSADAPRGTTGTADATGFDPVAGGAGGGGGGTGAGCTGNCHEVGTGDDIGTTLEGGARTNFDSLVTENCAGKSGPAMTRCRNEQFTTAVEGQSACVDSEELDDVDSSARCPRGFTAVAESGGESCGGVSVRCVRDAEGRQTVAEYIDDNALRRADHEKTLRDAANEQAGAKGINDDEFSKAARGLTGRVDMDDQSGRYMQKFQNNASKTMGYRTQQETESAVKGWQTGGQMVEMAGQTTVTAVGQAQALDAQKEGSMNATYEAAATTARAAAIQQGTSSAFSLLAGAMLMSNAGDHNKNIAEVESGVEDAKKHIDDHVTNPRALNTYAGLEGSGKQKGQSGYINTGKSAFMEKMRRAGDINASYDIHGDARFETDCADDTSATTNILRQIERGNFGGADGTNTQGFVKCAGQWYEAAGPCTTNNGVQGPPAGGTQLTVSASSAKFTSLVKYRCKEQARLNRVESLKSKAGSMNDTIGAIGAKVTDEQAAGARAAEEAGAMHLIQAAVKAAAMGGSLYLAGKYDELANQAPTPEDMPTVDTSFDPLAANAGEAPRAGSITGLGGDGQDFAAGTEDSELEEDEVGDLGEGFNDDPIGTDPTGAPTGPEFKLGDGGGKGGGSGIGGLGGGTTSAAKAEDAKEGGSQMASNGDGKGRFGGGGNFGGGGGGRRGGDGNSGIDLNSLLGQFLPGKEEKKDDSILDFGQRAPAGQNESLLDRHVDIFQRIHNAYQERGRKGIVGN